MDVAVFGDGSTTGSFTRLSTILNSRVCDKSAPLMLRDIWGFATGGLAMDVKKTALPPLIVSFDDFKGHGHANVPVGLIVTGAPVTWALRRLSATHDSG